MSNLVKRNLDWPATSSVDDFLNDNFFNWPSLSSGGSTLPRVNITETGDDFRVEMAAPGMKKEDFNIELDNDNLVIWTQMEDQNREPEQQRNYTRREFSYQSFRRSFYLPNTVEANKIEAKYRDGILMLTIPKKEEAKRKPARRISIS